MAADLPKQDDTVDDYSYSNDFINTGITPNGLASKIVSYNDDDTVAVSGSSRLRVRGGSSASYRRLEVHEVQTRGHAHRPGMEDIIYYVDEYATAPTVRIEEFEGITESTVSREHRLDLVLPRRRGRSSDDGPAARRRSGSATTRSTAPTTRRIRITAGGSGGTTTTSRMTRQPRLRQARCPVRPLRARRWPNTAGDLVGSRGTRRSRRTALCIGSATTGQIGAE